MSPEEHKLTVLETCQVFPRPRSARRSSLPLTFFDLVFLPFHPVQRVLFFELPSLGAELAKLKHSLGIALHYYYPLAGSLAQSPHGQKLQILCSQDDSVSLSVAESSDDFYELSGDHARDLTRLRPLVPPLATSGAGLNAVFAVQVVVFPNVGIALGTTVHHAIADGSTYANFMKLWATVHRVGEHSACSGKQYLPFYDRGVVRDPKGLESIFFKDLKSLEIDRSLDTWDLAGSPGVALATFVFSHAHLERLRRRVASRRGAAAAQCSPFALASGFVWAGLVQARADTSKKTEHFGFVTGCRARLVPPLPSNYFGNCLGICRVEAARGDLTGDDGAAAATDAIWKVIQNLAEDHAFGRAEHWIRDVHECASKKALTVAGSSKLRIYEMDFGWRRPRKVELISIERTGALSVTESREEVGGLEVGLALPGHEMERFVAYFLTGLSKLH